MNIGKRIYKQRKNKNLTQEELAKKLYVTDKTISSWEMNRTEPNLEIITKISEILECSITYLLCGVVPKSDIEIEIKIKLTEEEYKKLNNYLNKNAVFTKETHHIDTYYEPKHRRFYNENQKISEWLRIGERGNKNILNYKNWYDIYCDEYEVEIDDVKNLKRIFTILDLEELIKVDKKRKTYMYQNKYEIALDDVKSLGYYAEIEVKKYDKKIDEEYKELVNLAKSLGLNLNNQDKKGYPHILLENKKTSK